MMYTYMNIPYSGTMQLESMYFLVCLSEPCRPTLAHLIQELLAKRDGNKMGDGMGRLAN